MAKILKHSAIAQETLCLYAQTKSIYHTEDEIKMLQQQSFEQGYKCGLEQEQKNLQQEKSQLLELTNAIPLAIAEHRFVLETQIADVLLQLMQQVFINQQSTQQELQQQINQLLTQINQEETIELCLHPKDFQALQNAQIHLAPGHGQHIKIKSEPQLQMGGFIIKTQHGLFDASIEHKIEALKHILLEIKQGGCNERALD